eukprot:1566720-Rhodomonas_salina.5
MGRTNVLDPRPFGVGQTDGLTAGQTDGLTAGQTGAGQTEVSLDIYTPLQLPQNWLPLETDDFSPVRSRIATEIRVAPYLSQYRTSRSTIPISVPHVQLEQHTYRSPWPQCCNRLLPLVVLRSPRYWAYGATSGHNIWHMVLCGMRYAAGSVADLRPEGVNFTGSTTALSPTRCPMYRLCCYPTRSTDDRLCCYQTRSLSTNETLRCYTTDSTDDRVWCYQARRSWP